MEFKIAQRKQAKARIGLTGPSGSGKTWGALLIAAGLGESIAVIDTERSSASLYAGLEGMPEFSALDLAPPYAPERFIDALNAAAKAGFGTIIIDSITHEWSGVGGCLEINDSLAQAKFRGNTWSAWNETTPRHRKLLDAILAYPGHVIVTMRSKTETAQEEKNGRKAVVKLGMKAEQREGFEYELTTVLDIVHAGHFALASKDRTGLFSDQDPQPITLDTGKRVRAWLAGGAELKPEPPKTRAFDLDAALEDIHEAPDLAELRTRFVRGFKAATAANDTEALALLEHAKDERKTELTPHQEAA